MRNILITGGAGFIGSNYIHFHKMKYPDDRIVNYDILNYAGNPDNLNDIIKDDRYVFIKGDIRHYDHLNKVFAEYEIDTVVNFAAESHVDRSIINPEAFFETNILGTANLCRVAKNHWFQKSSPRSQKFHFHHISTDEVFGTLNPDDPPFTELTPYSPRSPYAASKASSDHIVRSFFHTYHLPITISNCSNNYGPYQYPEKLIPLMILNAKYGKPLPIYGDGRQIRDWLYVEDHCRAIDQIFESGKFGESYNFGGNNQHTNLEIATSICRILDSVLPESPFKPHEKLIVHVADRPGHDRRYAMSIEKVQSTFGWRPEETFKTGLEKTVRWYLKNEKWIQAIRQKREYGDWIDNNYSNRQNEKESQ